MGGATLSCYQARCWRIRILYASNKVVLLAYRLVRTPVTEEGVTGPPVRPNIAGGHFFLYASNVNMLLAYQVTCTPATLCPPRACHYCWRTYYLYASNMALSLAAFLFCTPATK